MSDRKVMTAVSVLCLTSAFLAGRSTGKTQATQETTVQTGANIEAETITLRSQDGRHVLRMEAIKTGVSVSLTDADGRSITLASEGDSAPYMRLSDRVKGEHLTDTLHHRTSKPVRYSYNTESE